jgi:hypothetical protein
MPRKKTPLAFGEGDTKSRTNNVLNYKKPGFWVTLVAVIAVIILGFSMISNPLGSVRLSDADDMHFSTEMLDGAVYGSLVSGDKILDFSHAKLSEVTSFIKSLRVSKKQLSSSRGGDRDSTNQIHLAYEGFGDSKTFYNLYFNFSADFTEVWLDNEVKPSFSYQVTKPDKVRLFFEKQFSSSEKAAQVGSVDDLWNARTKYVGDNSAVGRLIGLLATPEGMQYDHFKLHTTEQPYGIEIVYLLPAEKLDKYYTENASIADIFRKNAILLLALVDNADSIHAVLTDGEREIRFTNDRKWAEYILGCDVREYAESPEKLQELINLEVDKAK